MLRQPLVLGHLLLSLLVFTGMFTPYTYLADILQRLAGFSGSLVGWTLMGFGAVGLLGNWLGGRLVDRSPLGATLLFVLLMALGLAFALVPVIGNRTACSPPPWRPGAWPRQHCSSSARCG